MISDASEHAKAIPVLLYLYVPNADAAYQLALNEGATSIMEPADQFYGDRSGGVRDPAGYSWFFGPASRTSHRPLKNALRNPSRNRARQHGAWRDGLGVSPRVSSGGRVNEEPGTHV